MTKIFHNNPFNRVVSLLLVGFLLTTFPAGASTLALCLDEVENHIVDKNFNLDDCHSTAGTYLPLSDEHCFALAERENNDCVDVSLTNANTLNLPSKIFLTINAKIILSYVLPVNQTGLQQQGAGLNNSVLSQSLLPSSLLKTHRTVVLLI